MALLSTKLPWELAQTKWASILNPIIRQPILAGNQINSIDLIANVPKTVNHLLQRLPQGWFLIDKDADANIWRSLPFTNTTITLESSADTFISLYIY
jgi:hypothetical protein